MGNNGPEFRGRDCQPGCELLCQLGEIGHRTTEVGRPQSSGLIEHK